MRTNVFKFIGGCQYHFQCYHLKQKWELQKNKTGNVFGSEFFILTICNYMRIFEKKIIIIWILLLSQLFHDWYYVLMFLFCSMKNNLSKSKNKSLKHKGEQSLHFYLGKYFICSSHQGLMLTPIFNTWKSAYNILITIFNYEYFNNPNHTLGWVFSC